MNIMEQDGKPDKILNRESWLKVFVTVLFSVIFTWKFITTPISVDLQHFGFNEFLSLVLALFAISLSVAFYFQANNVSNKFYDNMYKFTNEISVILGRIESGFGERLRHLDEGYSGLAEKFNKIPLPLDTSKAEMQLKQGKEEIKREEKEQNELIEELMEKAKLAENEKKELLRRLHQKNQAIQDAMRKLTIQQRKLQHMKLNFQKPSMAFSRLGSKTKKMAFFIQKHLLDDLNKDFILEASNDQIRIQFNLIAEGLPEEFISDMKQANFMDINGFLTESGINFLKEIARPA